MPAAAQAVVMDQTSHLTDLLWRQTEPLLYITKEQFLQSLDGWTITPHEVDGTLVWVTLTKGEEFHFTTFGTGHRITRADVRRYLAPLIERYGCARTKTPIEDERQHRFNRLIGFKPERQDEYCIYYKMEKLRHV